MRTENTYEISYCLTAGLEESIESTGDFPNFLSLRRELNQFLLSLNYSNRADGAGQQIHFLFLALEHLENVDREIRIYSKSEDMISQERIHDKIRSLKLLILKYIRHLTAES